MNPQPGRREGSKWWTVSLLCPLAVEDDFASALRDLAGAPTCSQSFVGAALCGRPMHRREPTPEMNSGQAEGLPYGRLQEEVLVWTSLPSEPSLALREEWETSLAALAAALGVSVPLLDLAEANEEDWLNTWKQFFHPVPIGNSLLVRPPWSSPEGFGDRVQVVIQPGLAFGTGLHATTTMCLESLAEMVRGGETVLDLGTGSGVLAVAACKLGARVAFAVDNDPIALRECQRNCQDNGVAGQVFIVGGSLLTALPGRWDLLVCNIDGNVAREVALSASDRLVRGGSLILAGFTAEREPEIASAITGGGLRIECRRQEGPWLCLSARRSGAA